MTEEEARFHRAMIDASQTAKRKYGYNPTYFLRMVADYGAVDTARPLLATDKPSDGFTTLWMHGRLDLTVEAHVIKPEFAGLFSVEEIEIASKRLKDYGYGFDAKYGPPL